MRHRTEKHPNFKPAIIIVAMTFCMSLFALMLHLYSEPFTILGAPAWLKPIKFSASFAAYAATFIFYVHQLEGFDRFRQRAANLVAGGCCAEALLGLLQAARHTTSHYNVGTVFDARMFYSMGAAISVVMAASGALMVLLVRQRSSETLFGLGLRLGLLVTIVSGFGSGLLMITPTPEQRSVAEKSQHVSGPMLVVRFLGGQDSAAEPMRKWGAHTFGQDDGGPGWGWTNWSLEAGDMRPVHFVGIHAVQIIPLLAWLLGRSRTSRISPVQQRRLVYSFSAGYFFITVALATAALRGRSIVSPDSVTVVLLAVSLIGTLIVSMVTVVSSLPGMRRVEAPGRGA